MAMQNYPNHQTQAIPVWNASLSTMWARRNFQSLKDFFEAARQLGFAKIELNHQVNSDMLAGIDLSKYHFSSVHEPCPADISTDTLKARDWLISSPDEDCRQKGIAAVKRSIDLAHDLSVPVVVVHAGMVSMETTLEQKLSDLAQSYGVRSAECLDLYESKIAERKRLSGVRFEAAIKSIRDLLEYARRFKIQLGLENRYHFFDIPTPDEMEILLSLADAQELGFVLDVGHAQALDRLGFFPFDGWLQRFSTRIVGVHLHDVIGIHDHYAPGLGEVDFKRLAAWLPETAFRTFEVKPENTADQVVAGLQLLSDLGCIRRKAG
jgi:sugar phosphate isomerase/epimerase